MKRLGCFVFLLMLFPMVFADTESCPPDTITSSWVKADTINYNVIYCQEKHAVGIKNFKNACPAGVGWSNQPLSGWVCTGACAYTTPAPTTGCVLPSQEAQQPKTTPARSNNLPE